MSYQYSSAPYGMNRHPSAGHSASYATGYQQASPTLNQYSSHSTQYTQQAPQHSDPYQAYGHQPAVDLYPTQPMRYESQQMQNMSAATAYPSPPLSHHSADNTYTPYSANQTYGMQTPQHTPPQPSPAVVSVDPRHYTHDHASHEPPKAPRLQPAGASSTSKSRYIKSRQSAPDLSTALARAHILPHGHREAQARLQPLQPDDRAAFGLLTAAPSIAPSIGKLRKRIRIPQTRVPQLTQKGVALAINVSFHSLAQPGHGVRIMRLLDPKGKYDADLKEGSELAFPVERRRVHLGIYWPGYEPHTSHLHGTEYLTKLQLAKEVAQFLYGWMETRKRRLDVQEGFQDWEICHEHIRPEVVELAGLTYTEGGLFLMDLYVISS